MNTFKKCILYKKSEDDTNRYKNDLILITPNFKVLYI